MKRKTNRPGSNNLLRKFETVSRLSSLRRPLLIFLLLAVAVSALVFANGSLIRVTSADEQPGRLSGGVIQQIQALDAEKESRTPAQRQLDSQLVYAVKMHRGEKIAAIVPTLEVNVGADEAGMVTVDISADIDAQLLNTLKSMGIYYSSVFPKYHALRAVASLDQLEAVASLPQVRFITPKREAITNQAVVDEEGTPGRSMTFPNDQTKIERVRRALAEQGIGAQTNTLPNGYAG